MTHVKIKQEKKKNCGCPVDCNPGTVAFRDCVCNTGTVMLRGKRSEVDKLGLGTNCVNLEN